MSGINVIGMPFGMHGLGLELRDKVNAMRAAGIDVCILNENYSSLRSELRDPAIEALVVDEPKYDTNLICHNLPATGLLARKKPELFAGRYNIGAPYWEFPQLPDAHRFGLEQLDELWVATDFLKDCFSPHTEKPIRKMPLHMALMPRKLGLKPRRKKTDTLVFGYVFDFNSMVARKDPLLVISGFLNCFADKPKANVKLILKYKVERSNLVRQRDIDDLQSLAALDPRIELVSKHLLAEDMDALYNSFDVYISPHRAEGLGRGIIEVMLKGKAVAATAYSGPLEYFSDNCVYPLDYFTSHVGAAAIGDVKSHYTWADVLLEAVMDAMNAFSHNPKLCDTYGKNAFKKMTQHHGPKAHGLACSKRLGELQNG